jgi:hypothetical protein
MQVTAREGGYANVMATNAPTRTRDRVSLATRAGAALIALTGLIHLVEAPDQLEEKAYIGVLFLLAAAGSVVVAVALMARDGARAWVLGALIAAACFAGFVLSRTTGLPGFKESEWEALGVLSLVVEAGFLGLALQRLRR